MKTIIAIIALLSITSLTACNQQIKEKQSTDSIPTEFVEVKGTNTIIFQDLGKGKDIDLTTPQRTDTIFLESEDCTYIFNDNQNIPLVMSEKDSLQLLILGQQLKPHISFFRIEKNPFVLNKNILIIKNSNLKTQYCGYSEANGYHIVTVAQDSIKKSQIYELVEKYEDFYWAREFDPEKTIQTNDSIDRAETINRICEDTHRIINEYTPVECIAFNPFSGAMIIKHRAKAFLPEWKWEAANLFIRKNTSGKYNIDTFTNADEVTKNKFREDFLKLLDKLTE